MNDQNELWHNYNLYCDGLINQEEFKKLMWDNIVNSVAKVKHQIQSERKKVEQLKIEIQTSRNEIQCQQDRVEDRNYVVKTLLDYISKGE